MVELDRKLREAYPSVKIPAFPIDIQSLPPPPPKRKSTFLNTLSRLTSPTSGKIARSGSSSWRAQMPLSPQNVPSPSTSPSSEFNDPFTSFTASALETSGIVNPSANSTALASYFTTISNTSALRQARVWKRFVRVRTDDLESVRAERAIKRVRSDLAAHGGLAKEKDGDHKDSTQAGAGAAPCESGSIFEDRVDGNILPAEEEAGAAQDEIAPEEVLDHRVSNGDLVAAPGLDNHTIPELPEDEATKPGGDGSELRAAPQSDDALPTPVASEGPSRIPRSHSADFDKPSRLSRAYSSPAAGQDTSSPTEDESSASTTGGSGHRSGRKKRSVSMAPKGPKKSQRKVVIDDFEMMRVLGKGCAGKVLLVKHKASSDLYALKAITKRHVLAHQELQHTLTEQAVLKRMAAEAKDPFVVKLWWSFHDKENLFLVMVRAS